MFSLQLLSTQKHREVSKPVPARSNSTSISLHHGSCSNGRFKTESNLVNALELLLINRKQIHQSGFLKEFDCSNGIADMVFYELRKGWENHIILGEIPPRWAFAFSQLPYRKYFTASEFSEIAGVTKKRAILALQQYASLGLCNRNLDNERWIKYKQPRPIINKIYAVEAKLRDWKRALSQAYRYLEYANQSWVVMDDGCVKPALSNVEKFIRLNVGLATLKTDGTIMVHFAPTESSPRSQLKFWQANAEIARRIKLSSIS